MSGPIEVAPQELSQLLARAVGEASACREVLNELERQGLSPKGISRAQAVELLRAIGSQPGLVGIAARFAASRMILKWGLGTPQPKQAEGSE